MTILDQTDEEYIDAYRGWIVQTTSLVYSCQDGTFNAYRHGRFDSFEEALKFAIMLTTVANIYAFSI